MGGPPHLVPWDSIERCIVAVCRRYRLRLPEVDDFAQDVRVRFVLHGQQIMESRQQHGEPDRYLRIVISHHYLNWWKARKGDRLLFKGGLRDREDTGNPLDQMPAHGLSASADCRVCETDACRTARQALYVLEDALAQLSRTDRALLTRRFEGTDDIRTIADDFGITRKAAYHRFDRLLARLRDSLVRAGFDPAEVLAAFECLREAGLTPPPTAIATPDQRE